MPGRCAATMRSTHHLSETKLDASTLTPNVLSANMGKRWRAERNFWISFITFTLWWYAFLHPDVLCLSSPCNTHVWALSEGQIHLPLHYSKAKDMHNFCPGSQGRLAAPAVKACTQKLPTCTAEDARG